MVSPLPFPLTVVQPHAETGALRRSGSARASRLKIRTVVKLGLGVGGRRTNPPRCGTCVAPCCACCAARGCAMRRRGTKPIRGASRAKSTPSRAVQLPRFRADAVRARESQNVPECAIRTDGTFCRTKPRRRDVQRNSVHQAPRARAPCTSSEGGEQAHEGEVSRRAGIGSRGPATPFQDGGDHQVGLEPADAEPAGVADELEPLGVPQDRGRQRPRRRARRRMRSRGRWRDDLCVSGASRIGHRRWGRDGRQEPRRARRRGLSASGAAARAGRRSGSAADARLGGRRRSSKGREAPTAGTRGSIRPRARGADGNSVARQVVDGLRTPVATRVRDFPAMLARKLPVRASTVRV